MEGRKIFLPTLCHFIMGRQVVGYDTIRDTERGHVHRTSTTVVCTVTCNVAYTAQSVVTAILFGGTVAHLLLCLPEKSHSIPGVCTGQRSAQILFVFPESSGVRTVHAPQMRGYSKPFLKAAAF